MESYGTALAFPYIRHLFFKLLNGLIQVRDAHGAVKIDEIEFVNAQNLGSPTVRDGQF